MTESRNQIIRRLLQSKKTVQSDENLVSQESIKNFEQYILKGAELIKRGQYQEAIDHLRKGDAAEKTGLLYDEYPTCLFLRQTPSSKDIPRIVDAVANLSSFSIYPNPRGKIKPSTVVALPKEMAGQEVILPDMLLHEVALIHMEEWLHGLQHLHQKPIASQQNSEWDIAVYMLNHQVPMTETFLRRYDRKQVINKLQTQASNPEAKNFTPISKL